MPVRLDPRLREIDVGEWQGVTTAEVRGRDPELLKAMGRGEDVRRGRTGEMCATASPLAPASRRWSGSTRCRRNRCSGASTTVTGRCSPRRRWWRGRRSRRGGGSTPGTSAPDPPPPPGSCSEPHRIPAPSTTTQADLGAPRRPARLPQFPLRGCGAAGSAPPWHGGGQGFESPQLHRTSRRPSRFQRFCDLEQRGEVGGALTQGVVRSQDTQAPRLGSKRADRCRRRAASGWSSTRGAPGGEVAAWSTAGRVPDPQPPSTAAPTARITTIHSDERCPMHEPLPAGRRQRQAHTGGPGSASNRAAETRSRAGRRHVISSFGKGARTNITWRVEREVQVAPSAPARAQRSSPALVISSLRCAAETSRRVDHPPLRGCLSAD
jgi:hypothetical protein